MVKILKEVTETKKEVIGFKCDKCGTEITCESKFLRTDNFSLDYTCGYGTEHDMTRITADICDPCLVELIRKEVPNAKIINTLNYREE